ncbi:hypothetical protein LLG07_00075 [bacterium]|nr:hypothetical protein [bacterium]
MDELDFNDPYCEIRGVQIDYRPLPECKNLDTYGEICVKCNECKRFDMEEL